MVDIAYFPIQHCRQNFDLIKLNEEAAKLSFQNYPFFFSI